MQNKKINKIKWKRSLFLAENKKPSSAGKKECMK